MNPLLDQIIVAAIVGSALGWFLWRALRPKAKGACASDCGCGTKRAAK